MGEGIEDTEIAIFIPVQHQKFHEKERELKISSNNPGMHAS
jgi:orotate phosphoribosyltransferase-like protein